MNDGLRARKETHRMMSRHHTPHSKMNKSQSLAAGAVAPDMELARAKSLSTSIVVAGILVA